MIFFLLGMAFGAGLWAILFIAKDKKFHAGLMASVGLTSLIGAALLAVFEAHS